jgi:hypothetical protein
MREYWSVGVLEYWVVGEPEFSITPSLHHSIAPVQAARDLEEKVILK